MKTKLYLVILLVVGLSTYLSANPVNGLLERIDKGASKKFVIELNKGTDDFFELDQKGSKVVVRGNNYVNIATGINWYLKYYAGISRQGVHDIVKRCEQALAGYEEKLHLVEKFMTVKNKVKQIDELLDGYEKENAEELVADIRKISDEIIEEL